MISLRKCGAITSAVIGFGVSALLCVPPASATQINDSTNSIGCTEMKLAQKQKVQYCSAVSLIESGGTSDVINAVADATAYKLQSGQWVQDNSVQVSVDRVRLTVGGVHYAGDAYPTGPQAGRAYASTRGNGNIYRGQEESAYATASFSVWKNGMQVNRVIDKQGPTTVIPPLWGGPVGGGYAHPNADHSLVCTYKAISNKKQIRGCVTAGVNGVADVVAYKKVNGEWVADDSIQVSVDSVVNSIDGAQSGGIAYPTGPQAGRARASTRGIPSLDPSVSHTTSAIATVGIWKNGQEVSTLNLASNFGTIPAT